MRLIRHQEISEAVACLAREANVELPSSVEKALQGALRREESATGRLALSILLENAHLAKKNRLPLCQDTGVAVVFVRLGREVRLEGDLYQAIHEGVAKGYKEGLLRGSVADPLTRENTGDNTPAVVHLEMVPGEDLTLTFLPKGCGSENMSAIKMLPPSAGRQGIIDFVVETVSAAGANPCPPVTIGIGLGGDFEYAALLAKKALLRPLGSRHPREDVAQLEEEILHQVNALGIGPLGFGGRVTALSAHVELAPCHIASLPVAVNIQCHAARLKSIDL
ncbi:fumarate hydratase [Thermosulfuriphilus sp.]